PQKGNSGASAKGSPAPKSGQAMTKATRTMHVRPTDHAAPNNAIITHRTRAAAQRKAQRKMLQESAQSGGRASKKLGSVAVQAVKGIGKGVASAVSSILSAGGGAVVLVLLLTVILVAAIVASPFGILFSNESREAGVVPISAAVAQVNYEFNERLETLQTADDYDSISVTGQPADWIEVLAVFAVKVAGSNDADAADVATMDADRIVRLKAVLGDMTTIAHRIEVIHHPGSGDDDGWTERNLYITITAKTAEEMKTAYHFNRNQIAALDELLEQRDLLRELIEDVYSVSRDTAALLRDLPEGLSPEREAVVRTACSLVGKVNYFWGGKSLVIGWDARWGELRQVTAAGSSTTGTYRPYGLDCSGFVDWVFYNATGGDYIIGHGGGAMMQHTYCTPILWEDAQPGDLVFYPEDNHVGMVGGWDEDGNILIIHCASGYNNVVITGKEGFTSVGRPDYYVQRE
ncbi:C40 family peptidase, partial [Gemmiger sp.]|uniref:C40 family peptidase n=1 Tax=Gemmiger sp. TaxID=2049027 RepID=UPI003A94E8FD